MMKKNAANNWKWIWVVGVCGRIMMISVFLSDASCWVFSFFLSLSLSLSPRVLSRVKYSLSVSIGLRAADLPSPSEAKWADGEPQRPGLALRSSRRTSWSPVQHISGFFFHFSSVFIISPLVLFGWQQEPIPINSWLRAAHYRRWLFMWCSSFTFLTIYFSSAIDSLRQLTCQVGWSKSPIFNKTKANPSADDRCFNLLKWPLGHWPSFVSGEPSIRCKADYFSASKRPNSPMTTPAQWSLIDTCGYF